MLTRVFATVTVIAYVVPASAQEVVVKYRVGPVDLKHFACTKTVSSFVHEVCYDRKNQYMIIQLRDTRYPYCDIDAQTVSALLSAESKGRYYNASIKGRFGCRGKVQPNY